MSDQTTEAFVKANKSTKFSHGSLGDFRLTGRFTESRVEWGFCGIFGTTYCSFWDTPEFLKGKAIRSAW